MFVFGNFLRATAVVVGAVLNIYWWIIIAAAVLSWVNPDPYNPIVRFLRAATDPVMYRVRRVLPLAFGGIDFTPIVVLLLITFLQVFLVSTLYQMAASVGGSGGRPILGGQFN
jgi:YggT family protein